MTWRGAELFERADFEVRLDATEVEELRTAARACGGTTPEALTLADFPLPVLAPRLHRLRDDLEPLAFHTDRCDVIAFCCVRAAADGGETDLLSSLALYRALQERHPETVPVLRQAFPSLRHTVDDGNARPYTMVPVFSEREGHFAASLLRVLIDRADRSPDAPDLTPAQRQALDTLEAVAEDPALYARFRLGAGELLLLNNWVTMHRRSGFTDHADPAQRRHLLRLWLAVPNSRPLDPRLADHFGSTAAGAVRGGMRPA